MHRFDDSNYFKNLINVDSPLPGSPQSQSTGGVSRSYSTQRTEPSISPAPPPNNIFETPREYKSEEIQTDKVKTNQRYPWEVVSNGLEVRISRNVFLSESDVVACDYTEDISKHLTHCERTSTQLYEWHKDLSNLQDGMLRDSKAITNDLDILLKRIGAAAENSASADDLAHENGESSTSWWSSCQRVSKEIARFSLIHDDFARSPLPSLTPQKGTPSSGMENPKLQNISKSFDDVVQRLLKDTSGLHTSGSQQRQRDLSEVFSILEDVLTAARSHDAEQIISSKLQESALRQKTFLSDFETFEEDDQHLSLGINDALTKASESLNRAFVLAMRRTHLSKERLTSRLNVFMGKHDRSKSIRVKEAKMEQIHQDMLQTLLRDVYLPLTDEIASDPQISTPAPPLRRTLFE